MIVDEDGDPEGGEARCEACGRRLDAQGGREATLTRRVRSPLRRRDDGQGYVTGEVRLETRRARVCEACDARIRAGASVDRLRGRRAGLWAAAFAAALGLIAWLTPLLLPAVRRALFLG